VAELAPGKSFADLGGMFGVNGRVAFLAEEAGATEVVLLDGMDPSMEFHEEHERRSSKVRFVQFDLHDEQGVEEAGQFDVVWCAGVIYHSPNPYLLLEHLRRMTRETLLIGSHVIPEVPGIENACVFYPGTSEASQKAFAWAHAGRLGRLAPGRLPGAGAPLDRSPFMGYANYWWGLTPSALRSMLNIARFEVTDEFFPHPLFVDLLARTVEGESLIPPTSFSRERGRTLAQSFDEDAIPAWLDPARRYPGPSGG
jgi:SAM-dependent methyltransferase